MQIVPTVSVAFLCIFQRWEKQSTFWWFWCTLDGIPGNRGNVFCLVKFPRNIEWLHDCSALQTHRSSLRAGVCGSGQLELGHGYVLWRGRPPFGARVLLHVQKAIVMTCCRWIRNPLSQNTSAGPDGATAHESSDWDRIFLNIEQRTSAVCTGLPWLVRNAAQYHVEDTLRI